MIDVTVTVTILGPRGDPMNVALGAAHPQLRDMYLACFSARACPVKWAAQEKAAMGIGASLAARRCAEPYAEFTLAKLMRLFPTNSLAEIVMAERMDFLRLLPCLNKFQVSRPFWAGHTFDAARDAVAHPDFSDFWAHSWGADPADVKQAIAHGMAMTRAVLSEWEGEVRFSATAR